MSGTLAEALKRIDELERKLATADRRLKQYGETFGEYGENVTRTTRRVNELNGSIDGFLSVGAQADAKVGGMSKAFERLGKVTSGSATAIAGVISGFGKVGSIIPVVGNGISFVSNALAKVTGGLGGMTKLLTSGTEAFINMFDQPSRGIRAFDQDMFNLNKRFTGTIGEAQKFADSLKRASATDFAEGLHLTTNEMASFVKATSRTSLTQEQLNKVVNTGAGAVNLYAAATAFAKSANIDAGRAASLMNELMNKQGQSAQEATNTLGLYVGVAEETGLAIDKVAESLNSAVNSFAKIGMTADFGAPILKGFATTMTEMGLGIDNAIGLSEDLSRNLAGLANNYSMAYLTFQRGGLEMGGSASGGALSSGIALQAAYLDAEKTGDQADIANKLVRGMRDTLSSFTGGDIVTVERANEDPSMANQYYVQQQMLKSQFGIRDDNSAARVLDMLSRLDEATRTGDEEAQKKLAEQIEKESKGRDANLDIMEKMNRKLEAQVNLLNVNARNSLTQIRLLGAIAGDKVSETFSPGRRLAEKAINFGANSLDALAEKFGLRQPEGEAGQPGAATPARPFSLGPMNALRADASMMATPSTSNEAIHQMMEKYLGRSLGSNSEVMTSEIDRVAGQLANVAAPGDLQGPGGRQGLAIDFAAQIKQALEGWRPKVEVGVSPDARGLIQIKDDAQQVATPR